MFAANHSSGDAAEAQDMEPVSFRRARSLVGARRARVRQFVENGIARRKGAITASKLLPVQVVIW
jgi:hypothetical protein